MDETAIRQYIVQTFPGVVVQDAMNAMFFFLDPERLFPFATVTTTDEHDQASNLDRPGVYRLNVGVSKATFQALFGSVAGADAGHDFTALDRLLPHPVYGKMYWVCVLNPGPDTIGQVQDLLAEAYAMAAARYGRPGDAAG